MSKVIKKDKPNHIKNKVEKIFTTPQIHKEEHKLPPHQHQESSGEKILAISENITNNLLEYNNNLYRDNISLFTGFFRCSSLNDVMIFQEYLLDHNLKNTIHKTLDTSFALFEMFKDLNNIMISKSHD